MLCFVAWAQPGSQDRSGILQPLTSSAEAAMLQCSHLLIDEGGKGYLGRPEGTAQMTPVLS